MNFILGMGISHKVTVEGMWGLKLESPVDAMREYLTHLELPPLPDTVVVGLDLHLTYARLAEAQRALLGGARFVASNKDRAYPVEGRPGSTSAFSWLPDGTLKQVSDQKAGFVVEICEFSNGMKKMECSARQTDMKGMVNTYVESFDRL